MKYTYHHGNQAELKEVIKRIESGESKTFSIYTDRGRRVKYDPNSRTVRLLIIDDGVDQINPFYKEPEQVEEVEVVSPEEVVEEVPQDEPEAEIEPEAEVAEESEIVSEEESSQEEEEVVASDTESPEETEIREVDSLELARQDNLNLYESVSEEVGQSDECQDEEVEEDDDDDDEIVELTTDDLINLLVAKGYEVVIKKTAK